MAELKPMEAIMLLDFAVQSDTQICVHANMVARLVRCKDCREYDNTGYETPEFGYCRCLNREVQNCFYCGHGEKREDV